MAAHLVESVSAIGTALGKTGGDRPAADAPVVPPLAYAAYFDLLQAVLEDDPQRAAGLFDRVVLSLRETSIPFVRDWDGFSAEERASLLAHINSDASTRVAFGTPPAAVLRRAEQSVAAAMALLDDAAPEIAAEIRTVVRQVILVSGTVNGDQSFDGASVYGVFGALFLNVERQTGRVTAVDGLAHESAHSVLYARSNGVPFVENPPDERHASPLRTDPRPLDGTFHATFVSARMNYAHRRVLDSGLLDAGERAFAEGRLRSSRRAFEDGRATLRRHARLTPAGHTILAAASHFMDGRHDTG